MLTQEPNGRHLTSSLTRKAELLKLKAGFLKAVLNDFPILVVSEKIRSWYYLSWEEFLEECYSWEINPYDKERDWESFFTEQKKKFILLQPGF